MRVIIAGSRSIVSAAAVERALAHAEGHGLDVPTEANEPRPLEDRVTDNGDGTYTHVLEFAWSRLVRDEEPS